MDQWDFLDRFNDEDELPGLTRNSFLLFHGAGFKASTKSSKKYSMDPYADTEIPDDVDEITEAFKRLQLKESSASETSFQHQIEEYEVNMAIELCRHFYENNMNYEDMQILLPYKDIHDMMTKHLKFLGGETFGKIKLAYEAQNYISDSKITIVLLATSYENFDDKTQEDLVHTIVMGMHCSTNGCIIIGSFTLLLYSKHEAWKNLVNKMYRKQMIVTKITLKCTRHRVTCSTVTDPIDFQNVSPLGGCLRICTLKHCGHFCGSVCHPRTAYHEEGESLCMDRCPNFCRNKHPCMKTCNENCECRKKCDFHRRCIHNRLISNKPCRQLCDKILNCGHTCQLICCECTGEEHNIIECKQKCIKRCERGHRCIGKHSCSTPCPPCESQLLTILPICEHEVITKCYEPDFDVYEFECQEPCRKLYGHCNHPCKKKCYEECGLCEELVDKIHRECGHVVELPCYIPIIMNECEKMVRSPVRAICGHPVKVPCPKAMKMSSELAAHFCNKMCRMVLNVGNDDCEHNCVGTCWDCYQGRYHARCNSFCGKKLICGHECITPCSLVCPPCPQACRFRCEHYQCPYECGAPCEYICEKKCPYTCPHLSCNKTCEEICDREGCNEACEKILDCGHSCISYCGEKCPKLCRICDIEILLRATFSGQTEIFETDRFIQLSPCGHVILEESLTSWLNMQMDFNEIQLKNCPQCLQPLDITNRRYSKQIRENIQEVNIVKEKIYGSKNEILQLIYDTMLKIVTRFESVVTSTRFPNFAETMLIELGNPLKCRAIKGSRHFYSMSLNKVTFIEWVCALWEAAEESIHYNQQLWNQEHVRRFEDLHVDLFRMICERHWPLHPNEVSSIQREVSRLKDIELLYSRISLDQEPHILELSKTAEGRKRFKDAEEILLHLVPYTEGVRQKFRERFAIFMTVLSYTLEITDRERRQIVQAFGARAGRWFKCPNGHVYVVTECGGVTQVGVCNECGEVIGGENHMVLPLNNLAPEMDHANRPLYPTALSRQGQL